MTDTRSRAEAEGAVARRLHDSGARFTSGRRRVVAALLSGSGPLSPAELHDLVGDAVPLSSLYRTLSVLEVAGVVERTHDADGAAHYELGEWLTGHHHHLVCTECGDVVDLEVDAATERALSEVALSLGDRAGHRVSGHRLDLEGVCRSCRR